MTKGTVTFYFISKLNLENKCKLVKATIQIQFYDIFAKFVKREICQHHEWSRSGLIQQAEET